MVQYTKVTVGQKAVPRFSGYGLYTDVCGIGMALFGKWGQYEVGAHMGIKGKYYPVVEVGLGQSNHTDDRSGLHYKVHSPYFRVGMDYNLNKNLNSRNRYFVGLRYAFSPFSYDLEGPKIFDDYWGGYYDYSVHGVKSQAHWGELVFGVQTQIWRFVHLGWTARYKARIYEKQGTPGHAFYIPGYGKGGESGGCFGGSFNVIFEL